MKVMIDTNLVLDLLLNREPFIKGAVKVFEYAEKGQIEAYITANSVTDLVYILRKAYSMEEIKVELQKIFGFIKVLSVTAGDINGALNLNVNDFEDALVMQCSKNAGMDAIVTRNKKDFRNSPVECFTVEEWISMHSTACRAE